MIKSLKLSALAVVAVSTMFAQQVLSAQLEIKVTNLTQGVYFTPLLISAHSPDISLFEAGMVASAELQMMAEGGDISGLTNNLSNGNADNNENPAGGLLAPGMSVETSLTTASTNSVLSLVAMLLPTNDGFVGLNNWSIPDVAGTYTLFLNGYDAGTEVNDEIINGGGAPGALGIPADPGGMNGTGGSGVAMMEATQVVHIHRGNLGDDNAAGGKSDLTNTVHRWLNPVAKLTITVN